MNWPQFLFAAALTIAFAVPLGWYLAAVFGDGHAPGDRFMKPIERGIFRLLTIDPEREQTWQGYAFSVLAFGLVSLLVLYAILRLQGVLPFNPTHVPSMDGKLAFNTAASFITGTNWTAYAGESQASHLAQMAGLVVAQFTAGAIGLCVALAVVRGIAGQKRTVGNFWADLTISLTRVFLPLATLAAIVLVSQGVVQNLHGFRAATTVAGATQLIPGGPVATQEVIKLFGTNGGSFYNVGGAHPFENPTGFSNVFELLLVIVLPIAIVLMFGRLIKNRRQALALVSVMCAILVGQILVGSFAEVKGNPALPANVSQQVTASSPGGNMEGKDVRLGPSGSALLTIGTMGTTAGATNSALDSYTPVGGAAALAPIVLGVISPGGDGGGLYAILILALLAVFIAGLMVGRTPEFMGKKIGAPQMKLVTLYVLTLPTLILVFSAAALILQVATASAPNPGFHNLTEIVYAYASSATNNGSAFADLSANTGWYDSTLGIIMLAGRFIPMVLALAVAGSMAGARTYVKTRATLDTTGPTFAAFLFGVIIITGGVIYLPMFVLGPIGERLLS